MRTFIGVDLGSTTTKAVVMDEARNVLGRGITNSRSNYDTAAAIAKQAHRDGSTLREAALASGAVSDEDYDRWVDPAAMTRPD